MACVLTRPLEQAPTLRSIIEYVSEYCEGTQILIIVVI